MNSTHKAMYRPVDKEVFYRQLFEAAQYEREMFQVESTSYSEWKIYVGQKWLDERYYDMLAVDPEFFKNLGAQ